MITVVNLNSLIRNPLVWIGALILLDSAKPKRRKKRKSTRKGQVRKTARRAYKKKTTRRKTTKRKTTKKRKGRMKKGSPEAKAWGRKMKRLRSKK
tara:strand:- start:1876 stop:2160 length:285 start_codon:yes stop_codon:yes gene_type:complete